MAISLLKASIKIESRPFLIEILSVLLLHLVMQLGIISKYYN